jgi:hypothetical protein
VPHVQYNTNYNHQQVLPEYHHNQQQQLQQQPLHRSRSVGARTSEPVLPNPFKDHDGNVYSIGQFLGKVSVLLLFCYFLMSFGFANSL